MTSTPGATALHGHPESHGSGEGEKLNWLRAGVLGANDGIVATSGLIIGVAASGASHGAIVTAGLAGLAAGALSMAVGEYVSVSTQRDTEAALVAKEKYELEHYPEHELAELAGLYEQRGLDQDLAQQVAVQLTTNDALAAHAEVELGFDHENFTNPWHAAGASMLAFVVGSLIPLLAMFLLPPSVRVAATVGAAAVALALTGFLSARLGGANVGRAVMRNVAGGLIAMAVTYGIGAAVGAQIG